MKGRVATNPGNYDMAEPPETEQTLIICGADRVCSGPAVCDSDGTPGEDSQGSSKLE